MPPHALTACAIFTPAALEVLGASLEPAAKTLDHLYVITGTGHHSAAGRAQLQPAGACVHGVVKIHHRLNVRVPPGYTCVVLVLDDSVAADCFSLRSYEAVAERNVLVWSL